MSSGPRFSLLSSTPEERRRRRLALGLSPVFEAIVASIMLWALMSLPHKPPVAPASEEVLYFHPAAPSAPVEQAPRLLKRSVKTLPSVATPRFPRLPREEIQKPVTAEQLKIPRVPQPKIELPKAPLARKPAESFTSAEVTRQTPKREIATVHTGAFNPGSMAKGSVKRPLPEVQTGGFGAANGIPNDPAADSHSHVAQLGSFDLPSGPGHGNGTGGARGVRGTVASAGFGNGIGEATGNRPSSVPARSVHQGEFGSIIASDKATQTHTATQSAALKPVVILSKPDPIYPPEARRKHIQGQVILSVLFEASGRLRVLKVVQGLGYGMDAAAVQAAEHITFKPAERHGQPVDSTAMVHIIFQLAY